MKKNEEIWSYVKSSSEGRERTTVSMCWRGVKDVDSLTDEKQMKNTN